MTRAGARDWHQSGAVHAIESGQCLPDTIVALNMARVLQVSVEELFFIKKQRGAIRLARELMTCEKTVTM